MIESVQNPKVKYLVKLRRARVRRREGLFIVEGHREIKVGLQAEADLAEAFFCPALFPGGEQEACLATLKERGVSLIEMTQAPFEKVSIRENPDGLLVLARTWEVDLTGLKLGPTPLVLVGDGLEKPGNLGAILRSAAAMSVDAVLCVDPNLDLFNPNVVRASQGQLFRVPAWVGDKEGALSFLRRRELRICATSAKAKTSMWEANLKGATAIVIGSEAHGLDSFWLDAADDWLTIPMPGEVDSLNLSVAAGCLLAEVNRQRRTTG